MRPEADVRACREFCRHYHIPFRNMNLLALALTHRSYLHATGAEQSESNERLEFLGDSVLGLVVTEHLYQNNPHEHEGQLTKTKSLLVSKAILSRRALAMGLGRFVLMSHSEVESGGRQRLSILADAFESVIGAIYLDQGYEAARAFIERWLMRDVRNILSDKRHTNYKSQLQEYVQSAYRTHPIYHIRSEMGPDHSKIFVVEVLVGRKVLGSGKGRNKKEAEQAAARDALGGIERRSDQERRPRHEPERAEVRPSASREAMPREATPPEAAPRPEAVAAEANGGPALHSGGKRRRRRGGRGRRGREVEPGASSEGMVAPLPAETTASVPEPPVPPRPAYVDHDDEDLEEIGRPEAPYDERTVDPYAWEGESLPMPQVPPGAEGVGARDDEEASSEPGALPAEESREEDASSEPAAQGTESAPPQLYGRRSSRGKGRFPR